MHAYIPQRYVQECLLLFAIPQLEITQMSIYNRMNDSIVVNLSLSEKVASLPPPTVFISFAL